MKNSEEIINCRNIELEEEIKENTLIMENKINYDKMDYLFHKIDKKKILKEFGFVILILVCILALFFSFMKFQKNKFSLNSFQKEYIKECLDFSSIIIDENNKTEKVNLSIIVPINELNENIIANLRSIQKLSLKNIEIIYINNKNSSKINLLFNKFVKIEKRIVYLQNSIPQSLLNAYKQGILKAKGNYTLFVNQNDLLIDKSISQGFKYGVKKGADIIDLSICYGDNDGNCLNKSTTYKTNLVKQPELMSFFYEQNNNFTYSKEYNNIKGKIIKTNKLKKIFENINKEYYEKKTGIFDENIIFHELTRSMDSYIFINQPGYYKLINKYELSQKANTFLKDSFVLFNYLYDNTLNNYYSKKYAFYYLYEIIEKNNKNLLKIETLKDYDYITGVINKYLNCPYFSEEQLKYIKHLAGLKHSTYIY